ncbi:hypothetical protein Hanom_Chr10g00897971 [Helianthus anomalus]
MAQVMGNQRKLDVEISHNQIGYLSDHHAEHFDMFNSMIVVTAKVNRRGGNGVGSIEEKVRGKEIIITEAIVREVLKFGDQPNHPTTFERDRVINALRRMSYEGDYPTNKGGLDKLNQTQSSAMAASVNNWDCKYSAFIFDNMKKILENLKKKLFMLYPRFIQMILNAKYSGLVKSTNLLNLNPMGLECFDTVYKNRDTAKKHQFTGRIPLEKHGKFDQLCQHQSL